MNDYYGVRRYDVSSWELPTQQPTILMAQLCANFVRYEADGRILHTLNSDYDTRLRSLLAVMRHHGAQFLIFPEYACPLHLWPDFVADLTELADGSVCILPFEHLLLQQFEQLVTDLQVGATNRLLLEEIVEDIKATLPTADRQRAI